MNLLGSLGRKGHRLLYFYFYLFIYSHLLESLVIPGSFLHELFEADTQGLFKTANGV